MKTYKFKIEDNEAVNFSYRAAAERAQEMKRATETFKNNREIWEAHAKRITEAAADVMRMTGGAVFNSTVDEGGDIRLILHAMQEVIEKTQEPQPDAVEVLEQIWRAQMSVNRLIEYNTDYEEEEGPIPSNDFLKGGKSQEEEEEARKNRSHRAFAYEAIREALYNLKELVEDWKNLQALGIEVILLEIARTKREYESGAIDEKEAVAQFRQTRLDALYITLKIEEFKKEAEEDRREQERKQKKQTTGGRILTEEEKEIENERIKNYLLEIRERDRRREEELADYMRAKEEEERERNRNYERRLHALEVEQEAINKILEETQEFVNAVVFERMKEKAGHASADFSKCLQDPDPFTLFRWEVFL